MISYLVNYFNTDGLNRENNIKPIIDALKKSTNQDIEIFSTGYGYCKWMDIKKYVLNQPVSSRRNHNSKHETR